MKEYNYGEDFEEVWKDIPKSSNGVKTGRKEIAYKVFLRTREKFYNADLDKQLKAKNKLIKELLEGVNTCTNCGCTELLCGYRGYDEGCTSE